MYIAPSYLFFGISSVPAMHHRLVHKNIYHGVLFLLLTMSLTAMLKHIQEVLVTLFSQVGKSVHSVDQHQCL